MNERQIIEDQRDMIKALQRLTDDMSRQLEGKDEMIATLLAKVDSLESTVSDMNEKVQVLLDQISTYQRKLFGTSSEKNHGHDEDGKEGSDKRY